MPRRRPRRRKAKTPSAPSLELGPDTRQKIGALLQIVIGALILLSLRGSAGMLGEGIHRILTFFLGSWGGILALLLFVSGTIDLVSKNHTLTPKRLFGIGISLISFLGIMHMGSPLEEIASRRDELAGAIGFMVSLPFLLFVSRTVGYVTLATLLLIGLIIGFEGDIRGILSALAHRKEENAKGALAVASAKESSERKSEARKGKEKEDEEVAAEGAEGKKKELRIVRPAFVKGTIEPKPKKKVKGGASLRIEMHDTRFSEWQFPSFDLLDSAHSQLTIDDEALKRQAKLIEEKLLEFDIQVTVRDARPGPTVTQFTLEPSEGVKLSKIASLKNDLALALAAKSLRIEAPIPGQSLVGVEMPNPEPTIVHLREILESDAFQKSNFPLSLPLGRNVSGEAVAARLDEMPHLLIAGATGSGKSVCMNVFLLSLLYQNAPNALKLILIDPKHVELMPYDGIPHLLHPVIAEPEKALQAFRWAVAEMGRRLHRFADVGVRNLSEFNDQQKEPSHLLPRIIIVVDELADLMMREFRRDTEMMTVRIAQMARATGIHLLISTQRPSVDVITGLIKANMPSRIALRTVSSVDSRTIIDTIGAEDLLGKGDMLFLTAATPKPVRIQGIFVSTQEVERVINAVKIAGQGRITEQIGDEEEEGTEALLEMGELPAPLRTFATSPIRPPSTTLSISPAIDLEADDNGGDMLFFDAVRTVRQTGKASATLLQRQLNVGYARAARLLDIMERKGLVGPVDGAKPRKLNAKLYQMAA